MAIRILPEQVAMQIAAGEVIERPASVVKELVENALDAGARTILIEIEEGGRKLIRVTDDGSGIPADQAELAFCRYATSKLSSAQELESIATLGFRGEALASIASISHVALTTRAYDESLGTNLRIAAGQLIEKGSVGAPHGTIISVEHLFYNTPARLKFLKQEATERQHITTLVTRYAMAYPHIRFRFEADGRETIYTNGSGDLLDVIRTIHGLETSRHMLSIQPVEPDHSRTDIHSVEIGGYVGLPSLNRSNRNHITLFLNGRWIQDTSLSYAVIQAYHTMLMTGRYPVVILMINIPPHEVDVNVHPTKAEVRLRQPETVFSAVQRTVRHTLLEQAPSPQLKAGIVWGSPDWAARRDRLMQATKNQIDQMNLGLRYNEASIENISERSETSGSEEITPRKKLPMMRVLGQVGSTYIVAEGPEGLFLLDQHAAHERVLYEQFMSERVKPQATLSQELLEALVIELAPEQLATVETHLDTLRDVGFHIEIFGRNTVQLRAIPALFVSGDPADALFAAISDVECGEMPGEATAEQKLIGRVCKQAAIKAGQQLSFAEMQALVRQLEQCNAPQTCPHGRPTMLHLPAEELARQFGRLGAI